MNWTFDAGGHENCQLGSFPRVSQPLPAHNHAMEIIIDIASDAAGRLSGRAHSPELEEFHAFSGSMEFLACIEMLCQRAAHDSLDDPQLNRPQSTTSVKGPSHD